jgi:hypothetical protein
MKRNRSIWLLFLLLVSLSAIFMFINLSEFVTVEILQQTSGYPFGGEGNIPWYYKTPELYAIHTFIFGMLFLVTLVYGCWAFINIKKKPLLLALTFTLTLILVQLVDGQSS